MELAIKMDYAEFSRRMVGFERDIPFAISHAMMRTCSDAQDAVRAGLARTFVIRNKWVETGIRIFPQNATEARIFKNQLRSTGDATAMVGSNDEFMFQQTPDTKDESGRTHHGKTYAVPRVGAELPRETIRATTPKARWPGAYGRKRNVFVGRMRSGRGQTARYPSRVEAVWRRVIRSDAGDVVSRSRRKAGPGEHRGLELIYSLFKEPVKVHPKWPLKKQVEAVFAAKWEANALYAITNAIRTSRSS